MKFYMPVKVYHETDCVRSHTAELCAFGRKALIVTGRSSAAKCGALGDVEEALKQEGRQFCVFNEVEENPSVETIVRGAQLGCAEGADFVIGIGGGSPMDAAKAVAFLMKRAGANPADLYDASLPADALPVAAVPTTCGTGSEVTGVSVLTRHDKRAKGSIPHKIFPKLALVDAKYLAAAPRKVLVNTSVDAFAHLAESFMSRKADAYSMAPAIAGLSIWGSIRDCLLEKKAPAPEELQRMMRASVFGGMAIAQTGTCLPHALGYTLTYELGIPHGPACGYFLAGFLKEAGEEDREAVLDAAGFADFDELEEFLGDALGNPAVPQEILEQAYETMLANTQRLQSGRVEVDAKVLRRIVFN